MSSPSAAHIMDDDPSLTPLPGTGLGLLWVGRSSMVYALDEHTVVKFASVWANDDAATRESLQDLSIERSIYERLGPHPQICRYFSSDQGGILLERFGVPMRKHLQTLTDKEVDLPPIHAMTWAHQLAEGIAYLHQKGIIHGDIGCHNILVNGEDIKICDFGGASVDGKPHGARYEKRSQRWDDAKENPSIANELFAVGSTLFEIWTGTRPYENEPDDIVEDNYKHHRFPDLDNVDVDDVIENCWHGTYSSADELVADITTNTGQDEDEDEDADVDSKEWNPYDIESDSEPDAYDSEPYAYDSEPENWWEYEIPDDLGPEAYQNIDTCY